MMNLLFKVSKTGLPLYQVGHQLYHNVNIHLVGKGLISEGLHNGKPGMSPLHDHVYKLRSALLLCGIVCCCVHYTSCLAGYNYIAYSRSIAFQFVHRVIRIEVCLSR